MFFSRRFAVAGLGGAALIAAGAPQARAQSPYVLSTAYDVTNFFDAFDFFTDKDPTNGYVEYVDRDTALHDGLIGYGQGDTTILMGVDHTTVNPANGRRSVRVTSQQAFTHGLFIADIAHMPSNTCGVWPAFWMFGPNWPSSGEIDIVEGVNSQTQSTMTLHTSPGYSITNAGTVGSTHLESADCAAGNSSQGCGQPTADSSNYGSGFNAIGGGVFATEWTSDHIAVWFFSRATVPSDIAAGRPDPSSWGLATARFNGGAGCDIDAHFRENNLVFDTTFCGDWAGNADVWGADAVCSAKAATCQDYVANNPGDFDDAYWEINSINVYRPQPQGYQRIQNSPLPSRIVPGPAVAQPDALEPDALEPDAPGLEPDASGQPVVAAAGGDGPPERPAGERRPNLGGLGRT